MACRDVIPFDNRILNPFVQQQKIDDFELDSIIQSTRDEISKFITENALKFVTVLNNKGFSVAASDSKKYLNLP